MSEKCQLPPAETPWKWDNGMTFQLRCSLWFCLLVMGLLGGVFFVGGRVREFAPSHHNIAIQWLSFALFFALFFFTLLVKILPSTNGLLLLLTSTSHCACKQYGQAASQNLQQWKQGNVRCESAKCIVSTSDRGHNSKLWIFMNMQFWKFCVSAFTRLVPSFFLFLPPPPPPPPPPQPF